MCWKNGLPSPARCSADGFKILIVSRHLQIWNIEPVVLLHYGNNSSTRPHRDGDQGNTGSLLPCIVKLNHCHLRQFSNMTCNNSQRREWDVLPVAKAQTEACQWRKLFVKKSATWECAWISCSFWITNYLSIRMHHVLNRVVLRVLLDPEQITLSEPFLSHSAD